MECQSCHSIGQPHGRPRGIATVFLIALSVQIGGAINVFGQARAAATESRGRNQFRPKRVVRQQPAIVNAPAIAADKVRGQVSDNELVLGVVINNQARAYPINQLTGPRREIINDTLGDRPIAATW